ncbi:RNA polymerase sigma factor [Neptuniibacter sp. QD48_11]|uniref:RNA polymerase sigma factor n=1 Tax=unclassified Neptuniibacter TaxID=2630693 RepID=UPI0039F516DB
MQLIEHFLIQIERRAFQIARIATGCDQDALDIVQDVMLKFVHTYSDKPEADWKPLFHRMLQNRINDFHRRKTLTNRIFSWISFRANEEDSEVIEEEFVDPSALLPEEFLQHERFGDALLHELEALPQRQQQTFLLRIWEGMSVKETAEAMACSEGSIKTHLSRATARLKQKLAAHNFIGPDHE